MAKISNLPVADPVTGLESVPIVQDNVTKRVELEPLFAPVEQARELAETASLTLPNVYETVAAGVAARADGETFWVKGAGGLELYRRVAGAGVLLDVLPSAAGFAGNSGFTLIKHKRAGTSTFARTAAQLARVGGIADTNVAHWIDPDYDEAILDGSNTDSVSAYLQNAIDDAGDAGVLDFFAGVFRCGSKLQIGKGVSSYGLTIRGPMGGYLETGRIARIELDPASPDLTLIEIDQHSGARFLGMTLKGKASGAGAPGSYVITASDINADVDLSLIGCTIGNAETIAKITGRGLNVQGCHLVFAVHGFELDWPAGHVSLGNDDHYAKSGMRGYRLNGNRIHGMSGGYLLRNRGANAHNIRAVSVTDNYADTNIRCFDGHANDLLFADNVLIHLFPGSGTLWLFNIEANLNGVAGFRNRDIKIINNLFAGQLDDSYVSGGNPSVADRWMGSIGQFNNLVGFDFQGNEVRRTSRDVLALTDVEDFDVSRNRLYDVCLDAARTLTLTGVTGVFLAGETITGGTSGATGTNGYPAVDHLRLSDVAGAFAVGEVVTGATSGATATIATSTQTDRYPFRLAGAIGDGYIGKNTARTAHKPATNLPIVKTSLATSIGKLRLDKHFFDTAKWKRDDYFPNPFTNIPDDTVMTKLLESEEGGLLAVQASDVATMETAIVSYKLPGTDSIQIVSDPSGVFSAATPGPLAGATGPDTKINISVVESGGVTTLYVENRRGGQRAINVVEMGLS